MNKKEQQQWKEHYGKLAVMFSTQHFDYVARLIDGLRKEEPWKADMFCKALFDLHHKRSVAL